MIKFEGKGIGYIDALNLDDKLDFKRVLRQQLFDLVIDCNKTIPDTSLLLEIYSFQKTNNRCFVIILPIEQQINYPESWDLVTTKIEALDFISFEQMQRDLGF